MKMPKEGEVVWFLSGQVNQKPMNGTVVRITNIDRKGLSNTYMDIEVDGVVHHVNIAQVFDHKPNLRTVKDEYGETKRWV